MLSLENLIPLYQLILILISRLLSLLGHDSVGHAKANISRLPEEILSELFLYLDGNSFLAMKQVRLSVAFQQCISWLKDL